MFSKADTKRKSLPSLNGQFRTAQSLPLLSEKESTPTTWSQDDYRRFKIMMNPQAIHLVSGYLEEEKLFIKKLFPLLKNWCISQFIAVGDANFSYYPMMSATDISYLCVDPLAGNHLNKQESLMVHYYRGAIEEHLDDIHYELNTFTHFTFNVVSYIQHAAQLLSALSKVSPIITLSVWSDNHFSRQLFRRYEQFMQHCLPHVQHPLQQHNAIARIIQCLPAAKTCAIKGRLCTLYVLMFDQETES